MEEILRTVRDLGFEEKSKIYKTLHDIFSILSYNNITEEERNIISQLLSDYGYSEISSISIPNRWMEFDYGNVKTGTVVKVKEDAYSSETGQLHNGRVGFVLDISGRRCLVRYAGTRGKSEMRHPIDKLLSAKYGVE